LERLLHGRKVEIRGAVLSTCRSVTGVVKDVGIALALERGGEAKVCRGHLM
jgi:hypothetical protein